MRVLKVIYQNWVLTVLTQITLLVLLQVGQEAYGFTIKLLMLVKCQVGITGKSICNLSSFIIWGLLKGQFFVLDVFRTCLTSQEIHIWCITEIFTWEPSWWITKMIICVVPTFYWFYQSAISVNSQARWSWALSCQSFRQPYWS